MAERRVLVRGVSKKYRQAKKMEKGAILAEFVEMTGYSRQYASRLLRNEGKRVWVKRQVAMVGDVRVRWRRKRAKIYGEEVRRELIRLWEMLDYPCGKRLVAALPEVIPRLEAFGEMEVPERLRQQLFEVSAATIDRLLQSKRREYLLKGRSGTRPGTLLKYQIPIKRFADWDPEQAGFMEVDLVGHDGGSGRGDFLQTLNATDLATGWTEMRAVRNKAQVWVLEAIEQIRQQLPFAWKGLSSDNGGEFINYPLLQYCEKHRISFCRTRPNRKNDNCYVEQKNYSVVRRAVGYFRLDDVQQLERLNALYDQLRLQINFFKPVMKLQSKERIGSRITKHYDRPQTPYRRVLSQPSISKSVKRALTRQYESLNPAALSREIHRLREPLMATARQVAFK